MRQLLLLRHAKSSWDDPQLSDHARPLNLRGRQAARRMATAMRSLGLAPDVVLVSSARRTLQTMEALEPWDETPMIVPLDALYLAPASEMLEVIHGATPAARCMLVIGHNPGLHELAMLLAGEQVASAAGRRLADGYPSGALAEFAVTGPWGTLHAGDVRLTRFVVPNDLSEVEA